MKTKIVGISISISKNSRWYIPVGHHKGNQISQDIVVKKLSPTFSNPQIFKRAHNAIFDITVLENIGIKVIGLEFDTMIAAHVLGRRNLGLKDLVLENFGVEMTKIEELIGSHEIKSQCLKWKYIKLLNMQLVMQISHSNYMKN